jgi:diguanylate cyclase (GGDEF)-like protein
MAKLRFLARVADRAGQLFPAGDAELLRLQVGAFRRQIPLMYAVVCANAIALGWTHYDVAPLSLSVIVPLALVAMSLIRLGLWWRVRLVEMTTEHALSALRSTYVFALMLGSAFVFWSISLAPLGNAYQQMHVALFMGLTSFACAVCLMHVRTASLLLMSIALIPFTGYYVSSGNPVLVAVAINIALVAILVAIVQNRYFKDFKELAASRTEARRLHGDMAELAQIDSLTGLANRRAFFARLDKELGKAGYNGTRISLGLVDLDGFKQINDLYGHSAGDQTLIQAAMRMQEQMGGAAYVARLGGDEFGIIFVDSASDAELQRRGLSLCIAMREPFGLGHVNGQIGASVGFASYPDGATTSEELYECADYALYRAKTEARGTVDVYTTVHRGRRRKLSLIEQRLRSPEIAGEFSMEFQPIVDLATGSVVAAEALARWDHPDLGRVPPDIFIRAAERSGTICSLTQILFKQALAASKAWPEHVKLSFNLSVHDLVSDTAIDALIAHVRSSSLGRRAVQFEITETAVLKDFGKARRSIETLKAAGYSIALDDFGCGFSSLQHLHNLPIDCIKVDRSFTAGLGEGGARRSIVSTISDLSNSLGLDCVIEGVEMWEQSALLQQMGCRFGQGHYYSRSLTELQFLAFLAHPRPRKRNNSGKMLRLVTG